MNRSENMQEKSLEFWENRTACAAEISEAMGRPVDLVEWKKQGAPFPSGGKVAKVPVWRWIAVQKKGRGGQVDPASMPLREQLLKKQIEMLQAKLDALRGTMLDADETIRAITSAGEKVKTSLLSELPTKVVEFAQTKSTIDAIESVKTAITDALNSISKIPEDVARKGAK
jgi:hypothetical protein